MAIMSAQPTAIMPVMMSCQGPLAIIPSPHGFMLVPMAIMPSLMAVMPKLVPTALSHGSAVQAEIVTSGSHGHAARTEILSLIPKAMQPGQ